MKRIGKVSSVNKDKYTVTVVFEELDNMVSNDLKVMFAFGITPTQEILPKVGEDVVCSFIPGSSDGFCEGRFKV